MDLFGISEHVHSSNGAICSFLLFWQARNHHRELKRQIKAGKRAFEIV